MIGGYMAWAAWAAGEPAPPLQSMRFTKNVDADARRAAEADFHAHPAKARKLTWQRFLNRLASPYQPRTKPYISGSIVYYPGQGNVLAISYPREQVWLARNAKDGSWIRFHVKVRNR